MSKEEKTTENEEVKETKKRITTDFLLSKNSTESEKIAGVTRKCIKPMTMFFKNSKNTIQNNITKTVSGLLEVIDGKQIVVDKATLELGKKAWSIIVQNENNIKPYEKQSIKTMDNIKDFFEHVTKKYGKTITKKRTYEVDLFE